MRDQDRQFMPMPAPGYPPAPTLGCTPQYIDQMVHPTPPQAEPSRFKTNEEWVKEASEAADAAAARVLREVTIERLTALHIAILKDLQGNPPRAERSVLVDEYATLAGA